MPFTIPTLDDTRAFLVALGRALFPSLNFGSRRSYHGRKTTYLAGAVTQLHAHADSVQRDAHPLTAGPGKPINDWCFAVGVTPKSATPARKSGAGRVMGSATSTQAIGSQLVHNESGLTFQLASPVTIPGVITDPGSFVDADIVAVDVGSKTRLAAGEVLHFLAPSAGIETDVVLQLDLDQDGFDTEQFGSQRARMLATFSQTPSGGNQADFVKWALASLNTVATAYAYPNRPGAGTVDVVAFYNAGGTARSLSAPDLATVKAYIQTVAPFQVSGSGGGLRVLTTIADPQVVEIRIQPNGQPAFAFDWDDSSGPTVLTWTAATRQLKFAAALPTSLQAGDRLVLVGTVMGSGVQAQDGSEYLIESIFASDTVVLSASKLPVIAPAATDKIYSSGPLVTPIRAAIVAHLNGETVYAGRGLTPLPASAIDSPIGLDILADGIGSANPAGKYNNAQLSWSGGILLAQLFGIAKYKAGVRNVTIVQPAADYEATDDVFPLDGQIHYVTPGVVIVRSA